MSKFTDAFSWVLHDEKRELAVEYFRRCYELGYGEQAMAESEYKRIRDSYSRE
jgi:hypothetical protein